MKKISPSDKIYIAKSKIPKAGRGVFAKVNIEKGEIIERCPMIEIPSGDKSSLRGSILTTYFFYFGKKRGRLGLALGYGSLYNHAKTPNAKFRINPGKMIIEFTAIKTIKKDTEITFNYYGSNEKKKPLWFEV